MNSPLITSMEWQVHEISLSPGRGNPGDITVYGSSASRGYAFYGFFFRADAELLLNGKPVDLWDLLRWFHTAGNVRATVWQDQNRYGHVIKVEFQEQAKEQIHEQREQPAT